MLSFVIFHKKKLFLWKITESIFLTIFYILVVLGARVFCFEHCFIHPEIQDGVLRMSSYSSGKMMLWLTSGWMVSSQADYKSVSSKTTRD